MGNSNLKSWRFWYRIDRYVWGLMLPLFAIVIMWTNHCQRPIHSQRQNLIDSISRAWLVETDSLQPIGTTDTLEDFNFDKVNDIKLDYGYIHGRGTGSIVFLSRNSNYYYDTFLSNFPNISFDKQRKVLSGWRMGLGGGFGYEYRWENKWILKKEIYLDQDTEHTLWKVTKIESGDTQRFLSKDLFVEMDTSLLWNEFY